MFSSNRRQQAVGQAGEVKNLVHRMRLKALEGISRTNDSQERRRLEEIEWTARVCLNHISDLERTIREAE